MASKAPFERLVRFETDDSKETYGDLPSSIANDAIIGSSVDTLDGDIRAGFKKTGSKATIRKASPNEAPGFRYASANSRPCQLLSPVPATNLVPCIGLNYRQHATEANLQIPTYPVVFSKPPDAITGPFDDIHIHKDVQSKLDYEGELTAIIGRDAKDVSAADALSYILGFTVGNDVSARDFQTPASVSGGQFGYAKSFDQFAPIGPCITATGVIGDPQQLNYTTKVNGEVRQKTSTADMIWSVQQIIEHLSRGTTLRAGTAIMTGTPSGVGLFMEPPGFLKDGDVVEIEVEGIGAIKNKVVFD